MAVQSTVCDISTAMDRMQLDGVEDQLFDDLLAMVSAIGSLIQDSVKGFKMKRLPCELSNNV